MSDPLAKNDVGKTREGAWFLSLTGFLPFAFLALSLFFLSDDSAYRPLATDALKTYGAVILSFLGGARWGVAVRSPINEKTVKTLFLSVVPSLAGWFSLYFVPPVTFAVLALAFAAQGAWDSFAGEKGIYPAWFAKLRIVLTLLVTTSMILAIFATL